MAHIVYIPKEDHNDVILDCSGSARHSALSKEDWANEYATAENYAQMRADHAGSVADVVEGVTIGKWLPDWSGPFTG